MSIDCLFDRTITRLVNEIKKQALPTDFISTVYDYYWPVAQRIPLNDSVCLVGIQGSQGSGKSTFADFLKVLLETQLELSVVVMSIDDFYLSKQERVALSSSIHPLFKTRGVPSTHNTQLLQSVINCARQGKPFDVPVFDKSIDDCLPTSQWKTVNKPVDVIILEGWCVGLPAEPDEYLKQPVNELEADEDIDCLWRNIINNALKNEYQAIFKQLDYQIFLQAPSFKSVHGWRLLQEQKMIQRLNKQGRDSSGAQTPEQITRFISHYQRLTEHALRCMPSLVDCVLRLNNDHSFSSIHFSK